MARRPAGRRLRRDVLPAVVQVTRDGVVESRHDAQLALASAEGVVLAALGDIDALVYARSTVKPFQAAASAGVLASHGAALAPAGLAIASGSHAGSADQQIEAAHLLACAGLDESALRCPPALPADHAARCEQETATTLAHNCSGKHAAFLWAHTVDGGRPGDYLDPGTPIQERVRETLARASGADPTGPGVDGCGAPAWRLSLVRLAVGFARLAGAPPSDELRLAAVRAAMRARPDLVGGLGAPDAALMAADDRVVAKRGAEGVLAAGFAGWRGPVGVAVKVVDGAGRAAAPPVGAVLRALGATVPAGLIRVPVAAGGGTHGWVEPTPHLADWAAELG